MGLLDSILPGNQSGKGGGISPITLGLLALLAYRTYQGKGRLADMLPRSGAAPNTAPGSLPGRDQPGSGTDAGGLGSILGNLLDSLGNATSRNFRATNVPSSWRMQASLRMMR